VGSLTWWYWPTIRSAFEHFGTNHFTTNAEHQADGQPDASDRNADVKSPHSTTTGKSSAKLSTRTATPVEELTTATADSSSKLSFLWDVAWKKITLAVCGLAVVGSLVYFSGSWNPLAMFKEKNAFDTAKKTGFLGMLSSYWFYPTGTVLLGSAIWFRKQIFGCGAETSGAEDAGFTRRSFIGRSLRTAKKSTGLDGRFILAGFVALAIAAALVAAWFFYGTSVTPSDEEAQEPDIENQLGGP